MRCVFDWVAHFGVIATAGHWFFHEISTTTDCIHRVSFRVGVMCVVCGEKYTKRFFRKIPKPHLTSLDATPIFAS